MRAAPRILGLASRLVVALWVAAGLAWYAAEVPLRTASDAIPSPEVRASVQARPEAPAAPAQAPPAPPAVASETHPGAAQAPGVATEVGPAELADGARLLAGGGSFPALSSRYDDFPSFDAYAAAMLELGARFVVVRQRRILGAIDPGSGRIDTAARVRDFSPRARDYTGEAALAPLLRGARERFGADAVVMMLVPRELDAGLFGGIAQALARRGEEHSDYREIHSRYERAPGGGVRLRVEAATRLDGTRVPLELLFDLAAIARAGGGPGAPPA